MDFQSEIKKICIMNEYKYYIERQFKAHTKEERKYMNKLWSRLIFYNNMIGNIMNFEIKKLTIPEDDITYYNELSGNNIRSINSQIVPHVKDCKYSKDTISYLDSHNQRYVIEYVIPETLYEKVKSLYVGDPKSMSHYIIILMFRYHVLGGINELLSVLPKDIKDLNIDIELFASPFNNTTGAYYSAFPDIESMFGSLGSFNDAIIHKDKKYLCNPPFDVQIIKIMYEKMKPYLNNDYNIYMVTPAWNDERYIQMISNVCTNKEISKSKPFYNFLIDKVIYITVNVFKFGYGEQRDNNSISYQLKDQISHIATHGTEKQRYILSELLASFLWYTDSSSERKSKAEELMQYEDEVVMRMIMTLNEGKSYQKLDHTFNLLTPYLHNVESIFDIGSSEEKFIKDMGKRMKANKSSYGIPSVNDMFSHIFSIMKIHEVSDVKAHIELITQHLKKGGYLIVREHNSENDFDSMIIDISYKISSSTLGNHKYMSQRDIIKLITGHGYELMNSGTYPPNKRYVRPQKEFYAIFRKN